VTRPLARAPASRVEQDRANLDECSIASWLAETPGAIALFDRYGR
jgi:hypothetical protein